MRLTVARGGRGPWSTGAQWGSGRSARTSYGAERRCNSLYLSDLPHAVAGLDITSSLGAGVLLDGTDSYHDVSSQTNNLGLCWCIELANDDVMWILNGGAVVDLPVGVHVATLHALDYYGQSAEDSLTITITSP